MSEYVVERILSIYIYCGVIFLFFLLIRQSRGLNQLRSLLCVYTVILTILAFLYIPSKGADVYRLMLIGTSLSETSWPEMLKWSFDQSTPIAFVYMSFVQSLNITGALSGITALIVISLIFSSVYTVTKKLNISNRSVAYYILFLMSTGTFFGAISGIRFALASAIMVNGMISAWYGKRNYFCIVISFIVPCLIHTGLIPIAAFWLLTLFLGKELYSRFGIKIFILLCVVMTFGVFSFYITAAFDKYDSYSGGGALFGIPMYIMSIISFFIYLGFFYSAKRNGFLNKLNESNKWILIILVFFEIFVIRDYVVFARYQYIFPFLLMP